MPVSTSALPLPSSSNSTLMSVSFVLRSTLPFRSMTRLLFEPCFHRARVIVQSLQPRQMSNLRRQGAERLFLCLNDRRTFQKIIGPQLGKHIRGDVLGIGALVREQKNLAWPGDGIDIDFAENQPLRRGDEDISRADDFVDLGNRLRPER